MPSATPIAQILKDPKSHEGKAARIQGFPDTYNFFPDPANPPTKSKLAKWIGDAVPSPLGYAAGISALGNGWSPEP